MRTGNKSKRRRAVVVDIFAQVPQEERGCEAVLSKWELFLEDYGALNWTSSGVPVQPADGVCVCVFVLFSTPTSQKLGWG